MGVLGINFGRAAEKTRKPGIEGPLIVVDYEQDDPTRGDCQGYKGIARTIADKLNGKTVFTDFDSLRARYPDLEYSSHETRLEEFFKETGVPQILFSKSAQKNEDHYKTKGVDFVVGFLNETLSIYYMDCEDTGLVCHPFTPEILNEEGRKFNEYFPDLPGPLIAVMLADEGFFGLAKSIANACQEFERSTIFVCTSRRTRDAYYTKFLKDLGRSLGQKGLADRVEVLGYNLNADRKNESTSPSYNPYAGLLDRADHVVVAGTSKSLISEPLAAGKSVHAFKCKTHPDLVGKGLVKNFNRRARKARFETNHFEPVNLTDKIAEAIIKDYQQKNAGTVERTLSYLKSWLPKA